MRAENLLFRILLYMAVNVPLYFFLFSGLFNVSFIAGYSALLIIFLLTVLLERVFVGREFYLQLPVGNMLFCAIAIYIPVPFLYNNLLLKTLSKWTNDTHILEALFITNLGLQAVLIGYNLIKLFPPIKRDFHFTIDLRRIFPFFYVYFISVLSLIATGNYGITQRLDTSDIYYITILNNFAQFGIVGLVVLVFYYPQKKILIYPLTALMSIIGLLSGFKEAAILPILAVGVSLFFVNRKIPWKLVFFGMIAIVIIFSIVTSFRNVFLKSGGKELTSVADLTSTYIKSAQEGSKSKYNHFDMDIAESILYRLNYAAAIGKVINYTEKKAFGLPHDSHPKHILGTPVYFMIPRFIMPSKPIANFGNYITREIYGYRKAKYSIGVSQTGYAFLWNGIPGVLILMTIVGMFQGLLYRFFYHFMTPIYIYLFISNIYTFDEIWAYTATFFRFSLILFIVLIVLGNRFYKRQPSYQFNT